MVEIKVCIGSACHLKGSYNVIQEFQHLIEENLLHDQIQIKANFCFRACGNQGVSVHVGEEEFHVTAETAEEFFRNTVMKNLAVS